MKIVRRILVTLAATLTAVFIVLYGIAPVAMSFYQTRYALPITRVVPADLRDESVSPASGTKLDCLDHEFEVPWPDLDESKNEFFPKDKPSKTMARLHFRSGLQVIAISSPPHGFADQFTKSEMKMAPEAFAAVFGRNAATSDYEFMKRVLEFSPDQIHHWTLSTALHAREEVLLVTKSIVPSKAAETGIFNVHSATYRGFQQGNTGVRPQAVLLDLYSSSDAFEIIFLQKDYTNTHGVTQPEINRVVQSLHKASSNRS